jgi:hypothetical protein
MKKKIKMMKRIFFLKSNRNDRIMLKKIGASLMLPIFIFQMTSLNIFFVSRAQAENVDLLEISAEKDAVSSENTEKKDDVNEKVVKEDIEKIQKNQENSAEDSKKTEDIKESLKQETADDAGVKKSEDVVPVEIEKDIEKPDPKKDDVVLEKPSENIVPAVVDKKDEIISAIENKVEKVITQKLPAKPLEIWAVDGKKATTNLPVELGKKYFAPQNNKVAIVFTQLPKNPGTLSIEEITLTPEQVLSMRAISNKAYDITSTMSDGTFKYKLTLPKLKRDKKVEVRYAETEDGLKNTSKVPAKNISIGNDSVSATLDHFTVFVLGEPTSEENSGWTNPQNGIDSVNETYASASGGQTIVYKNFNISIPAGRTIEGIEVILKAKTGGINVNVSLSKDGGVTYLSNSPRTTFGGSVSSQTLGSETDLWGMTWNSANFSNTNFAVKLETEPDEFGDNGIFDLDQISVNVAYSDGGDITPPVISSHADMVVFGAGPTGKIVTYTKPTATDNVDALITPSCIPASGVNFPVGVTPVTCNASDSSGNPATPVTFNITVEEDITPPVIAFHADVTAEATSAAGAIVTYTSPATSDNYDLAGIATCLPASGTLFSLGTHPIICSAADALGNAATPTTFNIIVQDTNPPGVSKRVGVDTIEVGTNFIDAGAIWTDLVDGNGEIPAYTGFVGNDLDTNTPGDYILTYTYTDAHNNSATATRDVKVLTDATPPVVTINPGTDTIEVHTLFTDMGATWSDNIDGGPIAIPAFTSGTLDIDIVGVYTVTYSKSDAAGNVGSAIRTVTVVDTTKPVIASHGNQVIEATSSAGAVVTYTSPATTDNYDPDGVATCLPASGSTFAFGTHSISCDATDANGNIADQTTFNITVQDTTMPVVTLNPGTDIVKVGTSFTDVGATWTDNYDGAGSILTGVGTVDINTVGDYTLVYSYTDNNLNTASVSRTVTVMLDLPPVVTIIPGTDTIEVHTPFIDAGANWTDAIDVSGTINPATSGAVNSDVVGLYFLSYEYTSSVGKTGTAIRTVTVQDTTKPVIAFHGNDIAEATNSGGKNINYNLPNVTDNYDLSITANCFPAPDSFFPIGTTPITCNVTDSNGNSAIPTTFNIIVQDTTAPTIDSHPDVTAEATSGVGTNVNYTVPTTTDLVDGSGIAICAPVSGTTFAIGTTIVTCNASDSHGNIATPTTFNVIVQDTTKPVLSTPSNLTFEATSSAGALVTYSLPTATDIYDPTPFVECMPASGATLVLGDTTVTCNAKDSSNNWADSKIFTIKVQDTTKPVIAPHANETFEATSSAGAVATYTLPVTSDNYDAPGTATCSPLSGTTFALGTTPVTCSAIDSNGRVATPTTFDVIVEDTTAPVIADHSDVGPVEAASSFGAVVTYTLPATTDLVDGSGVADCSLPSGSTFPIGTTSVTCSATDEAGNPAVETIFDVIVEDTTVPVITINGGGNLKVYRGEAYNDLGASWSDVVDGNGDVQSIVNKVDIFKEGTYTVTYSYTDVAGNAGSAIRYVEVVIRDVTNNESSNHHHKKSSSSVVQTVSAASAPVPVLLSSPVPTPEAVQGTENEKKDEKIASIPQAGEDQNKNSFWKWLIAVLGAISVSWYVILRRRGFAE